MIKCPNADCGYENVDGTQFCEGCGEELPQNAAAGATATSGSPAAAAASGAAASAAGATAIKCPACDNLNDPANEFCEVCGTALRDNATTAPDATSGADAAPGGTGVASAPAMPAGTSASTAATPPAPTAASGSVLSSGSGGTAASPAATPMAAATVGAGQTPPDVSISGLSDTSSADAITPVVAVGDTTSAVTPSAATPATPASGLGMSDDTSVATANVTTGASTTDTSSVATAPAATGGGTLAPGQVKLTVEQGMTIGKQFVLGDSEMQVGREDDEEGIYPDLDLSDQDEGYVHRKHATLKFENGGLTLTHLGGANKTRINNRPLPDNEAQPVNIGDKVAFGKVVMRVGTI